MDTTQHLSIDLLDRSRYPLPIAYAKQGDTLSRSIAVSLYAAGVAWTPPSNAGIVIRYRRPDGVTGIYDKLPDGSVAYSISDNTVTAHVAPDALSVPGKARLDIAITSGTATIATYDIILLIDAAPTSGTTPSNGYYAVQTLAEINAALAARVQTVNGVGPDADGNVNVSGGSGGGNVLSVNGKTGDVQIPAPATGVCRVAAGIPTKVVESVSPGASPAEGTLVYVKFSTANIAANPTLTFAGYNAPIVDDTGNPIPAGTLTAGVHGFQRRGSAWVLLSTSGGGSGGVTIDNTLSQAGAAADAKAVGNALNQKLALSGGTMTGDLTVQAAQINLVGANGEGAWIAASDPNGDGTPIFELMGTNGDEPVRLTGIADPQRPGDAANKNYVDNQVSEIQGGSGAPKPTFGLCQTAAMMAVKVEAGYILGEVVSGSIVAIEFTNTNLAANPTLTVNGVSGPIVRKSKEGIYASDLTKGIHTFMYAGNYAYWIMLDALDTEVITDDTLTEAATYLFQGADAARLYRKIIIDIVCPMQDAVVNSGNAKILGCSIATYYTNIAVTNAKLCKTTIVVEILSPVAALFYRTTIATNSPDGMNPDTYSTVTAPLIATSHIGQAEDLLSIPVELPSGTRIRIVGVRA